MYVVVDRIACRMDSSSAKPASRTIKSARRELTESIRQSGQARWAGQKVNITTPTTTTPLPPPPPPSPLTRSTHPTPTVLTRDTLILKHPSPLLPRRTVSATACKPTPRRNRASPSPSPRLYNTILRHHRATRRHIHISFPTRWRRLPRLGSRSETPTWRM